MCEKENKERSRLCSLTAELTRPLTAELTRSLCGRRGGELDVLEQATTLTHHLRPAAVDEHRARRDHVGRIAPGSANHAELNDASRALYKRFERCTNAPSSRGVAVHAACTEQALPAQPPAGHAVTTRFKAFRRLLH